MPRGRNENSQGWKEREDMRVKEHLVVINIIINTIEGRGPAIGGLRRILEILAHPREEINNSFWRPNSMGVPIYNLCLQLWAAEQRFAFDSILQAKPASSTVSLKATNSSEAEMKLKADV